MQGFEFCCPTKIVCGAHALDKLPETLAALQAAQADADALNVDQAYRLTLLELGITE